MTSHPDIDSAVAPSERPEPGARNAVPSRRRFLTRAAFAAAAGGAAVVATATPALASGTAGDFWYDAKVDGGAVGNGTTDDTAALNSAASTAASAGKVLYIPAGTYKITAQLDWTQPGLHVIGEGMTQTIIQQATSATGIVKVGGNGQYFADLRLTYVTQQTSTSSVVVTFMNSYLSRFERIQTFLGAVHFGFAANSYMFSNSFDSIYCLGASISFLDLRSTNGSTGSVWTNTYLNNAVVQGSPAALSGPAVRISASTEMTFNQLNIEDVVNTAAADSDRMIDICADTGDQGMVVINGLHFERVTLDTYDSTFIRVTGKARLTGSSLTIDNCVFSNSHAYAAPGDIRAVFTVDNAYVSWTGVWVYKCNLGTATPLRVTAVNWATSNPGHVGLHGVSSDAVTAGTTGYVAAGAAIFTTNTNGGLFLGTPPTAPLLTDVETSGAWTTYTPTFTNITGGAGSFAYRLDGKTLYLRGSFSAGTVTAAGQIKFSLPYTVIATQAATVYQNGYDSPNPWVAAANSTGLQISRTFGSNIPASQTLASVMVSAVVEIA